MPRNLIYGNSNNININYIDGVCYWKCIFSTFTDKNNKTREEKRKEWLIELKNNTEHCLEPY